MLFSVFRFTAANMHQTKLLLLLLLNSYMKIIGKFSLIFHIKEDFILIILLELVEVWMMKFYPVKFSVLYVSNECTPITYYFILKISDIYDIPSRWRKSLMVLLLYSGNYASSLSSSLAFQGPFWNKFLFH